MALVVEDGSVVTDADSYVSVAAADQYFTDRGSPAAWTGASSAGKESALRYATQWVDAHFSWGGQVVNNAQALDWPRAGLYDDENRLVSSTAIPRLLTWATCEAALDHLGTPLNAAFDRGGLEKRVRVEGAVEVEYMDWAPAERTRTFVESLLRPFVSPGLKLMRA